MIRKEDYTVMQSLYQRGVFIKDIAEELGVHPRTVSRALERKGAPSRKRPRVANRKSTVYYPKGCGMQK